MMTEQEARTLIAPLTETEKQILLVFLHFIQTERKEAEQA